MQIIIPQIGILFVLAFEQFLCLQKRTIFILELDMLGRLNNIEIP